MSGEGLPARRRRPARTQSGHLANVLAPGLGDLRPEFVPWGAGGDDEQPLGVGLRARRREAPQPLIVTACRHRDVEGAARFAQLAVLLHGTAPGLRWRWVGDVDADARAALRAAQAEVIVPANGVRRVAALRRGWLYVACSAAGAECIGEAKAVGLPCLVYAPRHANAVQARHGESCLICASEDELLEAIAQLLDSAVERTRRGRQARREAVWQYGRVRPLLRGG